MSTSQAVLVVDDDPWFAEQHIRTLEAAGFRADHVTDGIDGIAALDNELPDAVVLDVFLPGPNGIALLHEMKSYSDLSSLPVIVCSSNAATISLETIRPYGVVAVIDKTTMEPEDIVRAVRGALT